VLRQIENTKIYFYKFKNDTNGNKTYIGVISEESPDWITTSDKKGISASAFANFLMAGMKAQQNLIEKQQQQIDELRAEVKALKSLK
jgi:hypothetical protein